MHATTPGRFNAQSQQVHVAHSGTLSAAGSIDVDGPHFPYAGRRWDSLWVLVTTAAVAGTDTFNFQPQYHLDGQTYTVGLAISTATHTIATGRPFRCHREAFLDFQIPEGATLSVKVTRTGGSLVTPSFSFVTVGG